MSAFLIGVQVDRTTLPWPLWPPSGPKNEPKYTQNNQISHCPCSNRIVCGNCSLKSSRKCLCHVGPSCQCPGGSYHTSVAIGAPLRPNKQAQTNQIYLCPCSNRIEKGYHSLKSAREYLSHFSLPCRCQGGAHHTFSGSS